MRKRIFDVARRLDRGLFPFMGPAQVGAGYVEEPYRAPADPACPVCGGRLAEHEIRRSGDQTRSTSLICP